MRGVESGEVYVGTPYPSYLRRLSRLMAAFSARYPGIHLGLLEGMSSALAKKVADRSADFCIISRREGDFDFTPLTPDPLVALVSKNHPLAKRKAVTLDDLKREPFIMLHPEVETDCSLYLAHYDITPDIRFSCRDTYAVYHMVEAGLGITIDNAVFAAQFKKYVCALKLSPARTVSIGIASPREAFLSPAAKRFLAMSKRFFS